jgi:hypothetical protein
MVKTIVPIVCNHRPIFIKLLATPETPDEGWRPNLQELKRMTKIEAMGDICDIFGLISHYKKNKSQPS